MHKHIFYEFTHQMESFEAIIKSPLLVVLTTGFSWLVVHYVPSPMALFWLVGATLLDLITGLLKAWSKKACSTSIGFRRTVIKVGSYAAIVVLVTIFVNIVGIVDVNNQYQLSALINGLIGFMTFIELFSVCENLSLAYPNSPMTQYFIKPLMKLLKGRFINNNPINKIKDTSDK